MNVLKVIDRLAAKSDDWSDYLLPSAINESKQIVKSNIFSSVFLIGAICFSFISIMLYALSTNEETGQLGFLFFSGIMDAGLLVLIPMMLYQNMTSERSNGSFELMAITSISPLKIVLGKWQSGLMQNLVFGSIIMPGIIYCYFFNGIAISAIFLSLILTLFASQFMILFSIFLCSLGALKRTRLTFQLISTLASVGLFIYVLAAKYEMVYHENNISFLLSWKFIIAFSVILLFIILIELFFIAVSSTQLSTYSSNKSTFPRIVYTCLILVVSLIFILMNLVINIDDLVIGILSVHVFISFFFLMEKDELSRKLFLQINKKDFFLVSFFKRIFYPGKSSAFLLFVIQSVMMWWAFNYYFAHNKTPTIIASYYYNPYNWLDESIVCAIFNCIFFYVSCIYLMLNLVLKLFPHAKFGVLIFASVFIILVIFLFPIIPYINSRENEIWMVMNFAFITEGSMLYEYLGLNMMIAYSVLLIACIVASIKNNRSEEIVRDFIAGERGSS